MDEAWHTPPLEAKEKRRNKQSRWGKLAREEGQTPRQIVILLFLFWPNTFLHLVVFQHSLQPLFMLTQQQSSDYDLAVHKGWSRCGKCADHVDFEYPISLTVISLCKLTDWLHAGREYADHLDFVYLSTCDSHSLFKINRLASYRKRKCWSYGLWAFRSLSHSYLFAN